MMDKLLSVIIPVYNTEQTVHKTIESVLNQIWNNTEIILVDDGSPDNAGKVCDNYRERYECIKVIHKNNQGLGYARNSGLELAKGDFVAFLDSDDWIDDTAYEDCIRTMERLQCDAVYFGRKVYKIDGTYSAVGTIPGKLNFLGEEVISEFAPRYFGDPTIHPGEVYIRESSCCAMYRKSIIDDNNIRFLSERECLSEDIFFNLDICRHAKAISIIPQNYYNQGFNPSSLTQSYNPNRYKRFISMYDYLIEYGKHFPEIEDSDNRSAYRIIAGIRGIIRDEAALRQNGLRATYKRIGDIVRDGSIQEIFGNYNACDVDSKTELFIRWIRNENIILVYLFYLFKGLWYYK